MSSKKMLHRAVELGIRLWVPFLEFVSPSEARRFVLNLFFTPIKLKLRPDEQALLSSARESVDVNVTTGTIRVYAWGDESAPKVLLMHGWGGKVPQFSALIERLVGAGYGVVALDAPAHGESSGKQSQLLEFSDAVLAVEEVFGPFVASVGHSMGGNAVLLSVKRGLDVRKVVTIGTPSEAEWVFTSFAERINGSPKVVDVLREHCETELGDSLEHVMPLAYGKELEKVLDFVLVIHDEDDKQSPFSHSGELVEALGSVASHYSTKGLGHSRVLKDEKVLDKVMLFMKS